MLRCFILTSVFSKQERREWQYPLQLAPNRISYISHKYPLYQRLPQHIQMLLAIQRQHQTHCYHALAPSSLHQKGKGKALVHIYAKENPRNKAKQRPSVLGYLLSCFINSAILPRRSIEYTPLSFSKYSKRLKAFCNSVSLSGADASV